MPFRKSPEFIELDRADSPPDLGHSFDDDESEVSEIDELDPLKSSRKKYTDDASQPLRSVFDTEKNRQSLPWLDSQRRKGGWQRLFIPSRFCCMLVLLFFATIILLLSAGGIWVVKAGVPEDGESEPWYPSPRGGTVEKWKESYRKAADLVGQMTLVEKVNITSGIGWSMGMCVGNTGPVERLGFPSLCLQDGPLGLRFADNATAFPAGITVGATWSKDLMYERGKAHGLEARLKGVNVLLGPAMGPLGRLPAGGRNWEGFGSDPVLQGIAAAQTIKGIQDSGVIATAKHWIGNEQEHFRQSWEWGTPNAISSNIDDRTLHEIYAWPFAESVRAGVGSVMCAYNQVNNSYACQNSKLLNGILKDELGFQGFMQSDWLAQRSGVAAALAGLDMTMPGDGLRWTDGNSLWGSQLTKAVLNSSIPVERLNDMALRVVAAWYQLGQDDKSKWPAEKDGGGPNFSSWTNDETGRLHPGSPNSKETGVVNKFVPVRNTEEGGDHDLVARKVATEGIVMVKNDDNILPLSMNGTGLKIHGDGKKFKIGIFGEDAFSNPKGNNACDDRGCNEGTLAMGWGSGAVELPYLVAPAEALHRDFDGQTIQLSDWPKNDKQDVESFAAEQDLCLVFINSDAGEGFIKWNGINGDRNDLFSQKGGDDLVVSVTSNCAGDTVVVLHTVGPTILERWVDLPGVKAILIAHLPGQESGNAITDVIFGRHNPSGRLPYTIAKHEKDYGPDSSILRLPNHVVPQQNFSEGVYFDYRYFDKHDIAPRYEFGYGLGFSKFHLSSLFVHSLGLQTSEPAPRPQAIPPPELDKSIPDPKTALWPEGFRKLKKYIYPYIDDVSDIKGGQYPYPPGYDKAPFASPSGGGEGGNPDLYTPAATVQATLTNVGNVEGYAVVQLYISFPSDLKDADGEAVDTPVRVLRQFDKIWVGTSNSEKRKEVKMTLTRKDLSYWDVKRQNWIMPEGDFKVALGFSSRDLPLSAGFQGVTKLNFGGG
ncbi:putative beta-glucosidase e [Acrodontium crateriforme]|uniref:Probable beta-glucosidase E n=1 Tax=Acrodontium crateriforme TaxID=150365 RepID=A0AAQ3M2R6_9PEZI|nr:putative beta-glucosidase e [Acrodontium crateriforme]